MRWRGIGWVIVACAAHAFGSGGCATPSDAIINIGSGTGTRLDSGTTGLHDAAHLDGGSGSGDHDAGSASSIDAGSDVSGVLSTAASFDFGTLVVGGASVTIPFAISNPSATPATLDQLALSGTAPGLALISTFDGMATIDSGSAFPAALQLTPIAPTDLAGLSVLIAQSGHPTGPAPITGMVVPNPAAVGDTTFYACATHGNDGSVPLAVAFVLALVIFRRRTGSS